MANISTVGTTVVPRRFIRPEVWTMEILRLATALEACPVMRVEWYFEGCLACCEGLTAHQLVETGRGRDVVDFLRRVLHEETLELRVASG